ncbi:MAG: biotin synthase BioB [Planctomycetes bacterium]|nr:biotin synthase BioB [Planctomycetota bacterium]
MAGEVDKRIADLAAGPLAGHGLSRAEALELVDLSRDYPDVVLKAAEGIRRAHRGDTVHLCGIVAAKVGRCSEDCRWCSQSARHATGIAAHGLLDEDQLLDQARQARDDGAACFGLVTSGARPTPRELDRLCRVIDRMHSEVGISPCASLGMLDGAMAAQLAAAGCRRYNHNLETSQHHFLRVVTTHSYDDRVATARRVKEAGMELCCGGLFGLGESDADRVDLALAVRELDADVVPVNLLNPIPGTPLAGTAPLSPRQCLAIIAMMRFILPTRCIKIAGGREVNLGDAQSQIFAAGADGCLVGNYLTTRGRSASDDRTMIAALGLRIAETPVASGDNG